MQQIDKSYFLNQIEEYIQENDPLERYYVTVDYHSTSEFTIDARTEEEAKQYALDSFKDEFNMDEVDIIGITVQKDTP